LALVEQGHLHRLLRQAVLVLIHQSVVLQHLLVAVAERLQILRGVLVQQDRAAPVVVLVITPRHRVVELPVKVMLAAQEQHHLPIMAVAAVAVLLL
jgi:hypothetical protein